MARIEVITELLVNEIESFSKTVEVLKKQTNQLKKIDFSNQTGYINTHFNKNFKQLEIVQNKHLNQLTETLENTSGGNNLKFFIILTFTLIVLSIGNIFYAKYLMEKQTKVENAKEELKNHIIKFFNENPKAKKTYDKWLEK